MIYIYIYMCYFKIWSQENRKSCYYCYYHYHLVIVIIVFLYFIYIYIEVL